MAGAFVRNTLVDLLDDTKAERDTWVLGLFVNDFTPSDTTVIGDVVEASFPGYGRFSVPSWGAAFLNGANIAESDELLRTFSCTAAPAPAQTVYGYFLLDGAGNYVGGQRNPLGGTVINAAGQTYPVVPIVTLENG